MRTTSNVCESSSQGCSHGQFCFLYCDRERFRSHWDAACREAADTHPLQRSGWHKLAAGGGSWLRWVHLDEFFKKVSYLDCWGRTALLWPLSNPSSFLWSNLLSVLEMLSCQDCVLPLLCSRKFSACSQCSGCPVFGSFAHLRTDQRRTHH